MNSEDDELYFRREQSQIKHVVLDQYLERFAIIVGSRWPGILYIDGFSGPWNSVSSDLKDSSFAIALKQLRSARETVRQRFQKDLRVQCVFLERDPEAFARLQEYAQEQQDVETVALNQEFEAAVPDLVRMVKAKQAQYFPFLLIDPTGWKGFSMEVIAPLIQLRPCEVLINFMTSFIRRFVKDDRAGVEASFRRLFGDDSFKRQIEGLKGQEREDAVVTAYADRIAAVGGFPYVLTTVVLHPTRDRTHFHLVYATRSLRGVEVFKDAEKKALQLSEKVRADAKRRTRESASGQSELFGGTDLPERAYLEVLRDHYEAQAWQKMSMLLQTKQERLYDELYGAAMRFPMVQEQPLRRWLADNTEFVNQGSRRTPKTGRGDWVRRRAQKVTRQG